MLKTKLVWPKPNECRSTEMISISKQSLGDFAIAGGPCLFQQPLHVNKPWAGNRGTFDTYLNAAWQTRRFANDGPLALELEERIAERLGVANCVLMSNGTAAMTLLLQILEVSGEVILPSFTFISTAHVLMMLGLTPVFCDVDTDSWNMSTQHCQSLISEKTAAIIPTHAFGRACDVRGLNHLAQQAGVPLILDAAHAFDCSFQGKKIGAFGEAEVFSFHATKAFHTAEGGAVTCTDNALAEKLRLARNFGFVGHDRVNGVGTNAKMSELCAAMGLANLDSFDASVLKNKAVYRAYVDGLADMPGLSLVRYDETESNNYWYIALQVLPEFGLSRERVVQILQAENVLARRYFFPGCHKMQPYCTMPVGIEAQVPKTDSLSQNCLILPGGSEVDPADATRICTLFASMVRNASVLNEHFDKAVDAKSDRARTAILN